jgi:uracil-DNA glycosylase family 4
MPGNPSEPGRDCPRCPRLVALRATWREREPTWFNAPVPSFGPPDARLAIIGLAPGLRGANRTGRPFTGDYAGDLLYATLGEHGFARGPYTAQPDDGLTLVDCRIVNAVRCVPPDNKPTGQEIATCRDFLKCDIAWMNRLCAAVVLGRIAHDSFITTMGGRLTAYRFSHGGVHAIGGITVYDSYHCSRYNTNTGRLTAKMFGAIFAAVRAQLDARTAAHP